MLIRVSFQRDEKRAMEFRWLSEQKKKKSTLDITIEKIFRSALPEKIYRE